MKMKLQGAKLNNCDTIKEIRKCVGGICRRSWGISGPGWSMRCYSTAPKSTREHSSSGCGWSSESALGAKGHIQVHKAWRAVIPQEGESIGKDAADGEEAEERKSILSQAPVAKLPKEPRWADVLMGPDGVTSESPTRPGSDLLHILTSSFSSSLGMGCGVEGAGRGGCPPWESWKCFQ